MTQEILVEVIIQSLIKQVMNQVRRSIVWVAIVVRVAVVHA